MQVPACNNSTGPSPIADRSPYLTVSAAVSALTNEDQLWLSRLAARRLGRLRSHPGLARYLAGKEPADLVDEAIERLQSGSRRTKPGHLASHQAFLNHLQGVINSIANNYTRHAEPHVEHLPLAGGEDDGVHVEPPAAQDVRRDVAEREWLHWLLSTLEHSLSLELRDEISRLREAGHPGVPADVLVRQCSERLLTELQSHIRRVGVLGPEMAN
jgi:hypothetical protein